MIFKAKNEWGNTGIKSGVYSIETLVNDFKKNFQPQQRFNEKDTQAINNYVAKLDELKAKTATMSGTFHQVNLESMAWKSTMQDQSEEAQTFVRGLQNGTEKLDNMTKASKAAELGMRGLALAGNMLASFLVSSFISLLINVANASDEIADSAAQIGNSFKETTSDLDDYKIKVDELRNTIDDSSSSIDDVQNARKELMSIQDDLIGKYGTEESVVKSITDAVNGEANAWGQLKKKKWIESRNEFNNNFSNGTLKGVGKNISNFFNGYQNNIDRMKKEYGDYSVDINTGSITGDKNRKQAEDILSKFGTLTKSANNSAVKQLTIKGNAEEVYNTLLNIQSVFNDINNDSIGKNSSFVTELGNMAEAADDVVQKYQDFWTEYVLNEEILSKGSKYTSDYKDIINDYNDYQKAVENDDKETVKATKQTLVESISGAMDEALKNGDDDVLSFFQNMYPDLKSEVESWRFDIDFEANTNGLEDKVKNPVQALEDFSSDELKSDVFDPNTATKEQKDAYNTLIGVATQYGLTIDELIEKLQKMGLLSSDFEKLYDKTINRFKQDDQSKIEKFLKSEGITSEDDIKYFNEVTEDATSAAEAIKKYNAAKKAKKEADSEDSSGQYGSFKEGWKAIGNSTDDTFKDTQTNLESLAKAGQLTQKTFSKVSGADKWAESFKKLGLSTKDLIDRINKIQTASDQLSSMKSGISSISSVLAEKKDNTKHKKTRNVGIGADTLAGFDDTIKDLNSWKEFEKTLGNGKSSMADCQKVANKLATEWVNSNNFLSNLNETNQDYYKSTLREMGVVNADAVVHKAWVQIAKPEKEVKEELKNEGIELADATWKNVYSTKAYKQASKEAKTSLQYLYAQENILANSDLGLQEKVNLLSEFIKKTLGAAEASKIAAEAFHQVALAEEGGKDTLWYQKQYNKNYIDLYNKKMNKVNLGVKVTPDPVTSGSGGNSKKDKSSKDKSKDSKQEIDWIARKLEVLQKAIDTTSGKLQNLFSIKAKKNNINKQITETTALLKANRKAAKAYTAEANKVKLGGKLKANVRSGDYDITKYDSKTADKINKYQDLIDKARESQDAVQDNITSIHDLNQQKLDNITTWYDKLLEKIDAVTSKLQAKSDLTSKVRGMLGQAETGTKTEYTDTLKNQKSALKTSQTELKKYEAERKAQRKKLTGQTNSKNKSDRQITKEFLQKSGLSKKEIAKELKKFDTQRGKLKDKQLDDFDATTKSQSTQLKENVYSAMSEMLDTAQSLANIPLEKLSVTLDKLSTQFTVLENQASRAAKEIENAGTGLGYYTRKSQAQIDNKSSAQYQARLTKETAVSSRDAAANKLRAKGIDPSTIKTASDLEKFANNTDAMYWASQYLAGVSAVNDATSQLSSVHEDYASTVSSVTDNIIDERNKLYENERSRKESKHTNDEKEYDYTDASLKDRLDTIDVKLDHQKTDTVDSIKKQADKSLGEAAHAADSFYGYKTMGYLNSQPAWVQNAFNKAYSFMQKGYNFNPATDNISDAYISSDILEALKQAVQDGYLPSTEYEQVVKYNANIADGNNQYQTYANNKATYDYETVPNSFKEIFSTISDDADRTVSDIQRNIDAIENSLDSDLFANKTDSYKKEADYYANQKQVYVNEGDALRKQLALAEAKGLKQGSDTWNELMDQIHQADDNAEKAAQSYTNAVVNAFNSIGDIADRKITEIGKSLSNLDTQMSLYETQGHFITSEFYNGQGDLYQQQQEAELKKAADLQAELDADVASGKIKEYSSDWYEMKDKIDEATQSADDYSVKIAESTNKAFDAILQLGEKSREAITRMNDEADFYKDILGRDKLVNEKTGAFTANGVASISLSYEKMTNDIVDNQNIQREIEAAQKRYNNGNNPKYGIEQYNKDMDNLLSQQREAIKNYYDEREAVMSLISDGLQKQLDVLQDIVDKTKEAMDRTSDLRDYQNNVEEATKNISSLEKQLAVVQGNDSEEGRATAQSIQKQLEDAQKNLNDLEWDKKKSDMTNILDDLMENAQDYVDEKRDQVSDTLDEIRDSLQEDAPKVIETLQGLDDLWGTSMSDAFKNAVSTGDYSTITNSIDSAASKIAQAVYDSEKAKLESTPKPVIKESDKYSSKAEKLLNQYASKNVKVGTTRFETIFDQKMQDWKEGYHLSTDSARKMLKELTNYDVDGITDEFVHYMLIDTLKANHIGGFAKGGVIGALNEQVRKNNDDALISVQSGEGILTPQQTEMFQRLVGELPALVNMANVKVPNFPTTQNTSKTVNVELGDMHFDLPNVTDTDSFINAWKTDNKMKNFVSDVVTGAVTGDNSKAMRY